MKPRNLLILIVVAALLVLWAFRTSHQPQPSSSSIGKPLFADLPVNDVERIVISTETGKVTIAKMDKSWRVLDFHAYPANYNKVVDNLRDLADLTIGQAPNLAPEQLGELKLVSPAEAKPDQAGKTGTRVELFNAQDRSIGSLLIGKAFLRQPGNNEMAWGGYPDGQYVRAGDGRVYIVSKILERLAENVKTWLDTDLINVPMQDIVRLTVEGPDRDPLALSRPAPGGDLAPEDFDPEEEVDKGAVNSLAGGLAYLSFDDLADPALTDAQTGMNEPVVIQALTRDGKFYTLKMGATIPNSGDRYLRVSAAYEPPAKGGTPAAAEPDKKDEANPAVDMKALNEKLLPWTFIVKSYRAEPLLKKAENLVKPREQPKEPPAVEESMPVSVPAQ